MAILTINNSVCNNPCASYDITGITDTKNVGGTIGTESNPRAMFVSPDGVYVFHLGNGNSKIYRYTMTTPWDVSTVTSQQSYGVTGFITENSLVFNSDGTSLFILGSLNRTIKEYVLTTPWDLTTISETGETLNVESQEFSPLGLCAKSDGTAIYVIGSNQHTVFQYNLSTAWDLSTASYSGLSYDPNMDAELSAPSAIQWTLDGTRLIIGISGTNSIYEFTLTSGYDLSTVSYKTTVDFAGTDADYGGIRDVFVSSDACRWYYYSVANQIVQLDVPLS